ncbi:MAG: YfhO family protein, partial [Oscillospiraceae bacterium]
MHPKQTVFYSLVAALSALGLTSILFALGGLYPFGDCTLAWCDMQQQVVPLWMQLSDMLQGEVSPLYSLRAAGGMSLWGVLLFFVASPLSLLSVFWEKGDMLLFANVMTLLKLGCCAATSAWFFHKRYEKLALPTVCALSLGYAFSGYSMMYYQNSVWLDVMALFPLLLLSMEGLRRRGGGLSYGILLTLCIVTNYYLSYAILIFLALMGGTVCRLCLNGQERGRYALRLGFYTVLALLLSAPVWMPSLWEVLASARNEGLIQSLSGGALLTDMPTTICFLLCSAVTFVPALSCWRLEFPKEAPERAERALLPLLLIPLFVDPINRMWHTGSYQAFPVRYGFLTVLLLLSLSAAWLTRREELPSHSDSGALGTMIGALLVALSVSTLLP